MPQTPRELIAAEVRAEMARQKVTQRGLAKATGIPFGTLQRRLTLKAPFSYDELVVIAGYFDLPLLTLLGRAEQRADVA